MSLFNITAEDIKDAESSIANLVFVDKEEVIFCVEEVKEGQDKNGKPYVKIQSNIIKGAKSGLKHSFFFGHSQQRSLVKLLLAVTTSEDLVSKRFTPDMLVGEVIRTEAKISNKDGREYLNFWDFSKYSEAPDFASTTASTPATSTIKQQAVSKPNPQAIAGQDNGESIF